MADKFTMVDDQLATDVKTGKLSANEYMILVYMLQNADKKTGIIETNSRLLSIELNVDRVWVRNILTKLKSKKRIQSEDRKKTELRQKKGSTRPYSIWLCDAIPIEQKDRAKTERRQSEDSLEDRQKTEQGNGNTSSGLDMTESSDDSEKNESGHTIQDSDLERDKDPDPKQQQVNYNVSMADTSGDAVNVQKKEFINSFSEITDSGEWIAREFRENRDKQITIWSTRISRAADIYKQELDAESAEKSLRSIIVEIESHLQKNSTEGEMDAKEFSETLNEFLEYMEKRDKLNDPIKNIGGSFRSWCRRHWKIDVAAGDDSVGSG